MFDTEDNGRKSRLALFDLHTNERFAYNEVTLRKIGQWLYDGVPQAVGLHQDSNRMSLKSKFVRGATHMSSPGTTIFFVVTNDGNFVIRDFQLLPRVPQQMEELSQNAPVSHLSSLPLPNPFKTLKPRSEEDVPLGAIPRGNGRVTLDEERDLGQVIGSGSPSGFRALHLNGEMLAVVWSQQELTVSVLSFARLTPIYSLTPR